MKVASPQSPFITSTPLKHSEVSAPAIEGREARRREVVASLPSSRDKIAIFGSVDFYHPDTPALCDAIGAELAKSCSESVILSGADAVITERLSRAFCENNGGNAEDQIFHLVPEGTVCDDRSGNFVEAGQDSIERRYMLATCAGICISIEGGPGTADELGIALSAGKIIIPVARSGGASNGMFGAPRISRPSFVGEETWRLLRDETASLEATAKAVASIVRVVQGCVAIRKNMQDSQIEAIQKALAGALDITYSKRPTLLNDCRGGVLPAMAGVAHKVFSGKEHEPGLGDIYLGPKAAAQPSSCAALNAHGIGAIVNCTNTVPCYFKEKGLQYCSVAVTDECGADILVFLDGAAAFLHEYVSKGANVLVHCQMGISRSSTVVIAYLIRFWGMTRDEAYLHVKSRRARASPNPGFWDQLQKFEERCRGKEGEPDSAAEGAPVVFDSGWAKRSNALYATCCESPETLQKNVLHLQLAEVVGGDARDRLFTVCLDYIWGRGVLDIDLDWLAYICQSLETSQRQLSAEVPTPQAAVRGILRDKDSDFWEIWSGEVYETQIRAVLQKLYQKAKSK